MEPTAPDALLLGVFCKRKLEMFSCTQIALFSRQSQKNNMFSCDLRLDYLIFSLWCSSTSNHLLNGRNRHDDSVNGPWHSGLLSRHGLPGAFHSLPCLHLERPQFNLQVFPLNFRFISNAPRCYLYLDVTGHLKLSKSKTKSMTFFPMTPNPSLS